MSKRDFGTIKSLLHFDFPYYKEPNDGLDDDVGLEEWSREGNVMLAGNLIPQESTGTPMFGYRCAYFPDTTSFIVSENTSGIFNLDANDLIIRELANENARCFYNIDPPYVIKGKSLYSEYFSEQDHRTFRNTVRQQLEAIPWIITYDDCDLIREIYADYHIHEYDVFHSAHNRAKGPELIITNLGDDRFEW